MQALSFLNWLEQSLEAGRKRLGCAFCAAQRAYVLAAQQEDGGFPGRQGVSDLYYSEFGLRLLWLLEAPAEQMRRAAAYFQRQPPPQTLPDLFALLYVRRLLASSGIVLAVSESAGTAILAGHRCPGGGFSLSPGHSVSAYATFLAALCSTLLGTPLQEAPQSLLAIRRLQQSDGGFAQEPGGVSQTNATAAALAFWGMYASLQEESAQQALGYLAAQQRPEGGFGAHSHAPADLMSTFTALTALIAGNAVANIRLPAVARFVWRCHIAGGGFGAYPGDPDADVEYTFYGVGALALLAGLLEKERLPP